MYFISPVQYWARAHNGPIFDELKSGRWQNPKKATAWLAPYWHNRVMAEGCLYCDVERNGLITWNKMRREESNERAETAIWSEEMVAHCETLETLLTAFHSPSTLIF